MPRVVDINIRDHVRYTGDGLPNEPVNAPLPIGDPGSGVYNPTKRDIREAIGDIEGDRILAEAAAAAAVQAMTDVQGATMFAANRDALLANTETSIPAGSVFATRAEGYSYEVVASDGDLITAGGVQLRVVADGGRAAVKAWGAKADGLTDDAAAIRKAVESGLPLSWGDDTYRVASELLFSDVSPDWESDGATIFYDPPAPTQRAIHFTMGLNETFRSKGKLHIDANNKAFDGFSATATTVYMNAVEDRPDFVADDLSVTKARRSSLSFTGGNGIIILGGFRRVILTRPVVTNCTMAAGAEVFGAQGIFGITIGRISGTNPISPDYALIQDPYVDYVASDDPAYLNDQDGIRMFSERRRDGIAPDRRQYIVRGGKIKNARNRSIKMQTQNGLIEGVFLEKDQATLNLPNGMTINPDIDWQINGGTTRDITVHYDEASPPEIVRLVSHRVDETFTSGILDGLSGYIKLNALATAPILAYANADSDVPITRHDVKVLNVSLKGPISEVLRIAQRGVSSDRASVENIDAEITTAIFAPTSSSAGTFFAFARNVWNRGASLVPLTINVAAERIVSAQGCTGFIKGSNNFYSGEGQMLRVESIGPVTPRIAAAAVPITKVLANGETWDLPRHGLNNGSCIMFVSATIDNSASGVIGLGNGARALGVGPTIGVGLNDEPGTGGIKIWQPSGEGAKIKNAFGSTRTVSVLLFG